MNQRLRSEDVQRLLDLAAPLLGDPAAPRRIGRYLLEREVGRGGMGVVYAATDPDLGRRVAIKVLNQPFGGSDELRARFVREARATAALDHPGIAAVFEATPEFIVMRLVDGPPLSDLRSADRRTKVSLVAAAARALQHAHERGIIHRDVKPQNILVERGQSVVTDFGLAKTAAPDPVISQSGQMLGSPSYMAPEQVSPRSGTVDARADVWGLGATLYDMLTGRPPFVAPDLVTLIGLIAGRDPAPPSALVADIPRDLDAVVLRCLEKEPGRRYPSAAALADDLDRWLADRPVLATRPGALNHAARFARRHRRIVAAVALIVVALGVLGVIAWTERAAREASTEALDLSEAVAGILRDADRRFALGETESVRDRLHDGLARCRAFLARHDVAHAHLLAARLEARLDETTPAVADLDAALRLDPSCVSARIERGRLRAMRIIEGPGPNESASRRQDGEPARAAAVADLSAGLDGTAAVEELVAAEARALRAQLRGETGAARREWAEVLRLDRLHVRARLALRRIEIAEGHDEAAWFLAMSAVDLYRGFGPAYAARGDAYAGLMSSADSRGAVEQVADRHALAAADERVQHGDLSAEALTERASARLRLSDVDGALADFTALVERDPRDAAAHALRALVSARRAASVAVMADPVACAAAWDEAIAGNSTAITLDPGLAGAWNNRGVCRIEKARLLVAAGRIDDAIAERRLAVADFDAAVARAPRFALALANRALASRLDAEAKLQSRDPAAARLSLEAARVDIDRAIELRADDPACRVERALVWETEARVLEGEGRPTFGAAREAARADFDAAVALSPADPRALGLRGLHRLRVGDRPGGESDVRQALTLDPDRTLRAALESALAHQ